MIKRFLFSLAALLIFSLPLYCQAFSSETTSAETKQKKSTAMSEYFSLKDNYSSLNENYKALKKESTEDNKNELNKSLDDLDAKLEKFRKNNTKTDVEDNSLFDNIVVLRKDINDCKNKLNSENADREFETLNADFLKFLTDRLVYVEKNNKKFITLIGIILVIFIALVAYIILTTRRQAITENTLKQSRRKELDSTDFSKMILEVQDTERTRLSHEIHDTVAQDLRTIRLETELLDVSSEEGKERLNHIITLTTESITKLKSICYNLAPPELALQESQIKQNDINTNYILNKSRLMASLHNLCGQFEYKNHIPCPMSVADDLYLGKISFQDIVNIFRIVQEALTNVEKHSKALNASVMIKNGLHLGKRTVLIFITDDGIGIPENILLKQEGPEHLGLTSMRDRASILNGTLNISSEKGDGTEIKLIFPVRTKE